MPSNAAFTRAFAILGSIAIILWMLSWLKGVLVPLALAAFLAFLLSPPATFLQRKGLPRLPAVLAMITLACGLLFGIGWMVVHEVSGLVKEFPTYEKNINAKLAKVQTAPDGSIERLQRFVARLGRQIERLEGRLLPSSPEDREPVQAVRVVQDNGPLGLLRLWGLISPVFEPLATAGLALLLSVFMLLKREDLRDRLISLFGSTRLVATTKMLSEAGARISRYLLTQLLINAAYGVLLSVGLMLIGVPYAFLWGFLAGLLRYAPYVGPILASVMPIFMSVMVATAWGPTLMVMALLLTLELITNMVLEPTLYGRNIGVSETATIVMIAFWTWLWGPIGLVLATPLTVCLFVLGMHVPFLKFLDTMLGDRPVLTPSVRFYQRLLAQDRHEAQEIAVEHARVTSVGETLDALLLSALTQAKRDTSFNVLLPTDERQIAESVAHIAQHLNPPSEANVVMDEGKSAAGQPVLPVLVFAARPGIELTAIDLMRHAVDDPRLDVQTVSPALLVWEAVALAAEHPHAALVVCVMPPTGQGHANLLCVRLRAAFPNRQVLVACLGAKSDELEEIQEQLHVAGADYLATQLSEVKSHLLALRPTLIHQALQAQAGA